MKSLLIISLLCCSTLFAGDPVVPRHRLTEIEKIDQHHRVQQEIYEYINRLRGFQDSNYALFALDTVDAAGADTVQLSQKYSNTAYVVTATVKSNINHAISTEILSDSSFAVFADSADLPYYWIAIGVKGD